MKTVSIAPSSFSPQALVPAIEALKAGGLVVYPTDTLYGLGADPREVKAVESIFRIKGRARGQSLPLIAADMDQVEAIARVPRVAARLAAAFWPGPLTLVLPGASRLADGVAARDGTVALRIPNHDVARALARGLAHAITATSANVSGEAPTADASKAARLPGAAIAVLIDAGPARGGAPSTIVDVTSDVLRLVRAGAIAWDRVLESLK